MNTEFHYSVNSLSQDDAALWNACHTLEEIHNNTEALKKRALEHIPVDELSKWVIVSQVGLLGNSLYGVYISFKYSCLFTKKGRHRQAFRALRMMGVPFIKVDRMHKGYEVSPDGFEVVHIERLRKIKEEQYDRR